MDDVVCTACRQSCDQKATTNGIVCSHPFLDVLICKTCYQRIKKASSFDELCLWCANTGTYTTCLKCFKHFCLKCLKYNFTDDTYTNIIKKKNWTCFKCEPSLLAEHKSVCKRILDGIRDSRSKTVTPSKRRKSLSESSYNERKRFKRSRSCDSSINDVDFNCISVSNSPSINDRNNISDALINTAKQISALCFAVNSRVFSFKQKFQNQYPTVKIIQNAFIFNTELLQSAMSTLQLWKEELENRNDKWKKEYDIDLYSAYVKNSPKEFNNSINKASENKKDRKKFNLSIAKQDSEVTDDDTQILDSSMVPQITSGNDDIINNLINEPIPKESIIEVNILSQPREDDDIFSQETASLENVNIKNELDGIDSTPTLDNHDGKDDESEQSFIFDLNKEKTNPVASNENFDAVSINGNQTRTDSEEAVIGCMTDEKEESDISVFTTSTINNSSDTSEIKLAESDIKTDEKNMFEIDAQKIEFMENLNLLLTKPELKALESEGINEVKSEIEDKSKLQVNEDDANIDYRIEQALKVLNEDDSDLFDSDFNDSVSSTSFDEDDVEWCKPKPSMSKNTESEVNGHIIYNNNYLEEIRTSILKTAKLSSSSDDCDAEELTQKVENTYDIKVCCVALTQLESIAVDSETNPNRLPKNNDEQEIERLLNLDNLDVIKRKTDSTPTRRKPKKRKINTPLHSSESGSSSSDSDSSTASSLFSDRVETPRMSDISQDGMLDALINYTESSSDFNMGSDLDCLSSDSENEETENMKQKYSNTNNDLQSDNLENGRKPRELTAEELAKRKWRNDPLLRNALPTSSSSDSEEEVTGSNIVSEKTQKRLEELEKKQENRHSAAINKKTSSSDDENKMDDDIDNLDYKDDFKSSIYLKSESDSDIEFVSEVTKKAGRKLSPAKSSIAISSDDEDSEMTAKTKGRKNIRAILSEETLTESTKQANLLEKQRKDRLTQRHKNLDSILSQSQVLSQEEGLILDVDEKTTTPLIIVNSILTKRLKKHQQEGVKFMWESCYEGVEELKKSTGSGCILAHCMGLGKTFQVVTLIHTLLSHPITNTKHILIVCPLSLVENWENEFKKGLAQIDDGVVKVLSIRCTTKKFRLFKVQKWRESGGVLLMGYEAYQTITNFKDEEMTRAKLNIKKALVDPGPDLVVLDEGHLLKNGKNLRTQSLMKVNTKRRIILTGTPLQNNLKEYYHMVQFVKPNLLGNYKEYTNRFVNPITNGQFHDSTEEDIRYMKKRSHVLHKILGATIQRYEVAELKMYLPERHDYALFVQVHPLQMKLYTKYMEVLQPNGEYKGSIITNYHKLHSLWTHPRLLPLCQEQRKLQKKAKEVDIINLDPDINDADDLPENWWETLCPEDYKINVDYGSKFKIMLSIIKESEAVGDKILIFSTSLPELDSIEFFLQMHETSESKWEPKKDYFRMDGAVIPDERIKLCNSFNDESNQRARVFLISHRVGGLGLNLVAANRVILMDVNWNPAYDSQSVFRVYRFGQKKKCYVYRLISMGTMEEVVYQRQINKLAIAGRVVDEMQISRHYKSDDLHQLYRYKFIENQERPPLPVPVDRVLAQVLQSQKELFKYHEHQSLLENKPEEELNEDEMKLAWDEFNKENENRMRMIEEQKERIAAISNINRFLPTNLANLNNAEKPQSHPVVLPYIPTRTINNDKSQKPQQLPHFETVFIPNNPQTSNNPEPQAKIANLQAKETPKTKELQDQFYRYIRQFSHSPETNIVSYNPSNNKQLNAQNMPFERNRDQAQSSSSTSSNSIPLNNSINDSLRLNPAFQRAFTMAQDNSVNKTALYNTTPENNLHRQKVMSERSNNSKSLNTLNSKVESMNNPNKAALSTERSSKAKRSSVITEIPNPNSSNRHEDVVDLEAEQQKLMETLNKNMDITLSRLEASKPTTEDRSVLQQNTTLRNTSNIIEID